MKKIIFVLFICLTVSVAYANETRNNCGCGLGSMIFKDDDGLLSQTLAATTNGILGNQTFGITSGTLDCKQHTTLTQNKVIKKFIAASMDNLAKDIARGNGESLATLAELMKIPAEEHYDFFSTLQSNFGKVFPSADVTHIDVFNNIVAVINS